MEKLLTVDEVAQILRISTASIRRYLRNGEMGGVKLQKKWLIRESDLEKFIQVNSTEPKQKPEGE